jgi:hypothetical protein
MASLEQVLVRGLRYSQCARYQQRERLLNVELSSLTVILVRC